MRTVVCRYEMGAERGWWGVHTSDYCHCSDQYHANMMAPSHTQQWHCTLPAILSHHQVIISRHKSYLSPDPSIIHHQLNLNFDINTVLDVCQTVCGWEPRSSCSNLQAAQGEDSGHHRQLHTTVSRVLGESKEEDQDLSQVLPSHQEVSRTGWPRHQQCECLLIINECPP